MVLTSLLEMIGNTPLLDLTSLLGGGHARLVAKLEMMNPGGSVKDRPALAMIETAEGNGQLKPGMTIVEPTAGNTGIGLALVAKLKGYSTVFFVPGRMSLEKITAMRLYGANVNLVPKGLGMSECIERAHQYAETHGNCFVPHQFENEANPRQAEMIFGPEVHRELGYYPDGLAIGAGTGGTFTGLSRWLKQHNPDAVCHMVEPVGSILGGGPKGEYQIEGIGNSFFPPILDLSLADKIITVRDERSFAACKQLASRVGVLAGGSSGANFVAASALCKQLGEGKTVLTVFTDNMERYYSKGWVQDLVSE